MKRAACCVLTATIFASLCTGAFAVGGGAAVASVETGPGGAFSCPLTPEAIRLLEEGTRQALCAPSMTSRVPSRGASPASAPAQGVGISAGLMWIACACIRALRGAAIRRTMLPVGSQAPPASVAVPSASPHEIAALCRTEGATA